MGLAAADEEAEEEEEGEIDVVVAPHSMVSREGCSKTMVKGRTAGSDTAGADDDVTAAEFRRPLVVA